MAKPELMFTAQSGTSIEGQCSVCGLWFHARLTSNDVRQARMEICKAFNRHADQHSERGERKFVILRVVGNAPAMASCEACHLKFFVPMELMKDPHEAEEFLRKKYSDHRC